MKLDELRQCLIDCCNDITFHVDGLASGIMPEVANYVPTYYVWYGNKTQDFHTVDELLHAPFFGGKALKDIAETLDIFIS